MAESGRSPRNRALVATAIFFAVTLSLTWLWLNGGDEIYRSFFRTWGHAIYELFGVENVSVRYRLRYANYIPFLGLLAATPGIRIAHKVRGVLIGVPLIFGSHLVLNMTATEANQYQLTPVAKILIDGFPILLWAILCRSALKSLGALALGPLAASDSETNS